MVGIYQILPSFPTKKTHDFFVHQRPPFEWAPKPGGQRRAAAREPWSSWRWRAPWFSYMGHIWRFFFMEIFSWKYISIYLGKHQRNNFLGIALKYIFLGNPEKNGRWQPAQFGFNPPNTIKWMRIDGPTHDPGRIALRLGQETAVQDQDFLLQDLLLQSMIFSQNSSHQVAIFY